MTTNCQYSVVLATDIFDKELNDLRKGRWNRAFGGGQQDEQHNDLRATIVVREARSWISVRMWNVFLILHCLFPSQIEHIIQASDVSHTMQHWHIYRQWNERLFSEMFLAFRQGRMGKSPAEFWYKGELGFFDNYIIPLAKKLKECNVFGVSSDECLNYAIRNRCEWEERGEEVTRGMLEKLQRYALGDDFDDDKDDSYDDIFLDEIISNEIEV